MAEVGASYCRTAAQNGHLGLRPREENSPKIGLATSVFKMGINDRREEKLGINTKSKNHSPPHKKTDTTERIAT